jgi:hypothetical protein
MQLGMNRVAPGRPQAPRDRILQAFGNGASRRRIQR